MPDCEFGGMYDRINEVMQNRNISMRLTLKSLSVIGQQSHARLSGNEKPNSMMSHSHLTLSAESAALFLQAHHSAIICSGTIVCRQAKHKKKSV